MVERFKIQFLRFAGEKDVGVDAMARRVDIDLGRGKVLENQNVVVHVKHTKNALVKCTDLTIRRVFEIEKQKVKVLVSKNKLDIYMIVTNFELSDNQCDKLEETFKNCGAKEVIVIGNETLTQWLGDSQYHRLLRDDITGLSMNDN